MAKIRLTKSESKKQKRELKRYTQYLPTLQLKKQQLQMEVSRIQNGLEQAKAKVLEYSGKLEKWVDVFGEEEAIRSIVRFRGVETEKENIAGIDIPVYKEISFDTEKYDYIRTPLWVDAGVEAVKEMVTLRVKVEILEEQVRLLREELRTTTQRVNLFEKVKIPETKENIRKISIFLGDLQTAEVVTGKIAKEKIQRKEALASA